MMKFVALIGVITLASSSANADCAFYGLSAKVATPPKTQLTGGGGILVMATPDERGKLEKGDVALDTKWKLRDGTTPKKMSLAPGLAVYQVTTPDQVTPIELLDGKKVIGSVIGSKAKVAQFLAPKVKSIVWVRHDPGNHSTEYIDITLDAPPSDAFAVVLSDAKTKARSFALVQGTTARIYNNQDCIPLPNGTVPSSKGDRITLVYVNAHGRTSDRTQLMTIN